MTMLTYHFVFCPKFRKPVFEDQKVKGITKAVFETECQNRSWLIRALEILPDHVHLMLGLPASESVSHAAQTLKGTSARQLRTALPWLRGYLKDHFWARHYYCEGLGQADESTVKLYILNQESQWLKTHALKMRA